MLQEIHSKNFKEISLRNKKDFFLQSGPITKKLFLASSHQLDFFLKPIQMINLKICKSEIDYLGKAISNNILANYPLKIKQETSQFMWHNK